MILEEILQAKRRRLAAGELAPRGGPRPSDGRRFLSALSSPSAILAEIKHRSPSAGLILNDADASLERVARAYRRGGAAAISVVVEQDFFGGDPSWLPRVKEASFLPVLMKDFVVDEVQLDQAVSLGADAVLLIVAAVDDLSLARLHRAALERGLAVLVEAHDADEVRRAAAAGAEIVGINARNLRDFSVDLDAMARLGALLPTGAVRVAESGIRSRADVERLSASGFGAFLVGESLLRAEDHARAVRLLRGEGTTEVKVCGLTREDDIAACARSGVDWIGLNFSPRSPRRVETGRGEVLRREAAFAKGVVAVFAGNRREEILEIAARVQPDILQLCDPREPDASWPLPVWQVVRAGGDDQAVAGSWPGAALIYDTPVAGLSGGTGRTFDWALLEGVARTRPLVLAGGLTPENVDEAVRRVRPDVVDVASGVEAAPGVKDAAKVAAFVRAVREVRDVLDGREVTTDKEKR